MLHDTPAITRADKAWAAGYRGAGQTVAVIDSGVDKTHPFFTNKIVAEACFSQPVGGNTSYCPAGASQSTALISVGSTTKQNTISSFSNSASFLSLLAPGSAVTSSVPLAYVPGTYVPGQLRIQGQPPPGGALD